jgi:hypothetical protein
MHVSVVRVVLSSNGGDNYCEKRIFDPNITIITTMGILAHDVQRRFKYLRFK